jgi:hypothetical protein
VTARTRILAVFGVCLVAGAATIAQTKQKPTVTKADQPCHLSGPLAKRLIAAGSEVDRDAEYYLVSLGRFRGHNTK